MIPLESEHFLSPVVNVLIVLASLYHFRRYKGEKIANIKKQPKKKLIRDIYIYASNMVKN